MIELADIVGDFAASMERVDASRPIAVNVRTKQPYQPGELTQMQNVAHAGTPRA